MMNTYNEQLLQETKDISKALKDIKSILEVLSSSLRVTEFDWKAEDAEDFDKNFGVELTMPLTKEVDDNDTNT